LTSTIAFDRSVFGALLEFVSLGRGLLGVVYFGLGFSFLTTSFLLFVLRPTVLESSSGMMAVTSGGGVGSADEIG
jgi:hypothetical protein